MIDLGYFNLFGQAPVAKEAKNGKRSWGRKRLLSQVELLEAFAPTDQTAYADRLVYGAILVSAESQLVQSTMHQFTSVARKRRNLMNTCGLGTMGTAERRRSLLSQVG